MSASDDRADVEAVLAGNTAAFERIVRRWQGPLVNLAYRFCRDRGRAEDMAQEAFLRARRNLGSWRQDAPFSTWLFALATNLYRSEIRRIPPRTTATQDMAGMPDGCGASDGLFDADREQAVQRAVLALPAKYREALILFYFHEMKLADAARSLGLPEGTVKARLSRGREMLRCRLLKEIQ